MQPPKLGSDPPCGCLDTGGHRARRQRLRRLGQYLDHVLGEGRPRPEYGGARLRVRERSSLIDGLAVGNSPRIPCLFSVVKLGKFWRACCERPGPAGSLGHEVESQIAQVLLAFAQG